jgi:dTDP-4-amino-4,6-dideoxygalactose transaminase
MSEQQFLPFALPDIGDDEINEVVHALRSGWITTGPKTKQFETDFSAWLGGGVEAIAVNSATSGLHLALEAIGVGPGDEVITTPYTFTATAEVMRYLGAHPVLVDINPDTFNIDPSKIEAAITPRTKAILPVHFAGLGCDMAAILAIARKHGLKVVEDAAHALPTRIAGALVGQLDSDITVFSFYATKTITTGEGGMVVCKDPAIAKRCKLMRLHGINRDAFDRYTSKTPSWYYEIVAPGFKYNLSDVASAMGIHQLRKANAFQQRRHAMALRYTAELADLPLVAASAAADGDLHAWHLYVLRLQDDAPLGRDDFIQAMFDRGIGCSVHFIPLHLHPYWRDTYKLQPEDYPQAYRSYRQAVSLPIYTKMTDTDQSRVISAVREILVGR